MQGLQDGAAYDFDGTDDYIAFSADTTFSTGAYTVAAWIKSNDTTHTYIQNIVGYQNNVGYFSVSTGGKLAYWDYGGSNWRYGNTVLTSGKWHHVVMVYDGDDGGFLYLDGVADSAELAYSGTTAQKNCVLRYIGANQVGSTAANNRFFDGQIRDVKIFPSVLTAPDVRKLYSGENPKKNLNVELITNGTFTSNINGWTDKSGTGSSVSHEVGNTVLFTGAAAWGIIEQSLSLTANKTYHLRYEVVVAATAQGKVRVGTSSVGLEVYSNNSAGHTSTGYKDHFFTTSSTDTHYISIHDGYNGLKIDNVTLVEIETLVDFNPRSASSTKWFNQAIPSHYNGTLQGGVTLSAGSTDHKVNGDFTTTGGITVGGAATVSGALLPSANGAYNFGSSSAYWKNAYLEDTAINGTLYAGGAVTAANKLGVGGAPDGTYPLNVVGGGAKVAGDISFTAGNSLQWNNNSGTRINASHGSEFMAFDVAGTSNVLYLKPAGVGIGTTLPGALLHVEGTTATRKVAIFESDYNDTNPTDVVIKHKKAAYGGLTGTEMTRLSFEGVDNSANSETLGRISTYLTDQTAGSTGAAMAFSTIRNNTLTEALRITDGGRIVNSQTLNDSHRTAEPSLRFDGVNDYVSFGSTPPSLGTTFSFEVWIKPEVQGANKNIFTYCPSGNERRVINIDASGVVAFGYYEGSSWTGVKTPAVASGKWHHIVGTRSGSTQKIYLDGVLYETATSTLYTNSGWGLGYDGNTANTHFYKGEIRGHKVHNRALEADEVAAAYNGESTPWIYADAGDHTELVVNGSFTAPDSTDPAGNNSYFTGWGSYGTATTRYIVSNTFQLTASLVNSGAKWSTTSLVVGRSYRVYCTATGNLTSNGLYVEGAGVTAGDVSIVTGTGSGTFTCTASGTFIVYFRPNPSGSGSPLTTYFDNFSVTEVGEVAAYTPQSIEDSGQWYDTTSNANHGSISGATSVNNPLNYGQFRAVGKSDSANLLKLSNRNKGLNDYTRIVWEVEDGETNSTALYEPAAIQFKTTDKDAPKGRLEFAVADTGSYSAANDRNLVLDNDGSVTATSGTSANLIQVARVHSETITADSTNKIFRITHNLGTRLVVVQVAIKNAANDYRSIEVAHRAGDWLNAAAGTALMNNGPVSAGGLPNYTTLEFVTPPAADIDVTVIG